MAAPAMLAAALLVLVASAAGGQTEKPLEEQLSEGREAVERQRLALTELREQIEREPENGELWMAWIQQRSMLAAIEGRLDDLASGTEPSRVESERRGLELVAAALEEWIAARPGDAQPHLARARLLNANDPLQRAVALRDVAARFPDDFETQRAVADDLRYRGETQAATDVMTAYLAAHPDENGAFAWLHAHYQLTLHDTERADDLARAWIAEHPTDEGALSAWYDLASRDATSEERRTLVAEVTRQLPPEQAASWCGRLYDFRERSGLDVAADCYRQVLQELEPGSEPFAYALASYARTLGRGGDLDAFSTLLEQLPDRLRDAATSSVATSLMADGRCGEGVALLRRLPEPAAALAATGGVRGREPNCVRTTPFRELLADALATAEPRQATSLVQRFGDWVPVERLEGPLLERLAERPDDTELLAALADLYQRGGRWEARTGILERLVGLDPRDVPRVLELSDALLLQGEGERALAVLERSDRLGETPSLEVQERLAGLYLAAGRDDEARGVAERMVASSTQGAYFGHLILARLALAQGDEETAFTHYQRFLDTAPASQWSEARDLGLLLVHRGRPEQLEALLEAEWDGLLEEGRHPGGTELEWRAERLLQLGAAAPALDAYVELLDGGEERPDVLREIASLAEREARWDVALRARQRVRDLAPSAAGGWIELAEHHLLREEAGSAFATLNEAFDRVSEPPAKMWILWTDALVQDAELAGGVSEERLVEAIGILEEARQSFDREEWSRWAVDEQLQLLYRMLGGLAATAPSP